ncbi:hypothetical protein BegalDRAFT_3050 [Beggiatoa alba B18LD]|uniref:Uncharacterized protein n=1 Tax=Beggiatoa alba B18LD TaxID=395493 RepID=I3CJT3_9GAMM|nr:hypothetical protein [Beggiatoa alba]EIJ43876.1 hypothetical protein BegalDRAFT_3050 [Beggiatoa alba B18LD]
MHKLIWGFIIFFLGMHHNLTMAETEDTVIELTGKVISLSIEGGFFGIEGTQGEKIHPLNLPILLQKEGLPVWLKARKADTTIGIHQWGTYVNLIEISVLPENCLATTPTQ